ncbi:hypothetical protein SAMN04487770_1217 [Butyrivibrio sp. ob235]|uniref:hypothetical protein n=1 Tax=Butyrivibrio sp. ob235 TaxID=1761780 RepID=UPI0008BAC483|nr:hypothetical protein [Butyrivibrio sp. ob235]SEL92360.1 hypothetical protein SAMN04487770_1217 [Butyrivibrio sp. ob235]
MSNMNAKMIDISDVSWTDFASEGSEEWEMMVLGAKDVEVSEVDDNTPENLHDGLDEVDGSYYIVTDYETRKVSYKEAFMHGVNLSYKMAELGPHKGETEEQFNNELFRIIKIFYSDYTSLPDEFLMYAITKSKEALDISTSSFIGNHMMQTMCDFTKELQCRNNYDAAMNMFRFCKNRLFEMYYASEKYYDSIVEGFYISTKSDESMPSAFYDRSYTTEDNEYYPDVYYLKLADYYAEAVITASDKGLVSESIEDTRTFHDEYIKFMEAVQLYDRKERDKNLKNISKAGLEKSLERGNGKLKLLINNAALAYAAAKQVEDYKMIKKAVNSYHSLVIKEEDTYTTEKKGTSDEKGTKLSAIPTTLLGVVITVFLVALIIAPFAYLIKMEHTLMAGILFVGCVMGYVRDKDKLWKSTFTNDAFALIAILLLQVGHTYYAGFVLSAYVLLGWVMMH